jgi:hypothetical protein
MGRFGSWRSANGTRHLSLFDDAMISTVVILVFSLLAVAGAGASRYVANRPMVDLLGKSDRHIAHERPATDIFLPGHNKWDLAYSIRRYEPDVVTALGASRELRRRGYVAMQVRRGTELGRVIWVRRDSPNVLFGHLSRLRGLT